MEWSLNVNPVLQVSAVETGGRSLKLDLCGHLLVFKHTESQDNARVKSHIMSLKLP